MPNFFEGIGPAAAPAAPSPLEPKKEHLPGFKPGGFFSDVSKGVTSAVEGVKDVLNRREEGIDYYSGVPLFGLRAGLSRMDNDEEKKGYLESEVGEGNARKDKFGAWVIEPAGLLKLGIKSEVPRAIDEQRLTPYDVADVAGSLPGLVGGVGGAMAASGLGFVPGVAMAGLGAAGGKAYDEVLKSLQGYNKKGVEEEAKTLLKEAASMAAGEGVGRALVGAGTFLRGPYKTFSDPERNKLTQEALSKGLTPKLFQSSPHAALSKRFQAMSEQALGDAVSKKNVAQIEKLGKDLLATTGGKAGMPEAGELISSDILKARRAFSDYAAKLYEPVDAVSSSPIIPTASLKSASKDILESLPKTTEGAATFASPETLKFLNSIQKLPDNITATQMQMIRSQLRSASEMRNLVPGINKMHSRELFRAADQTFTDAAAANAANKPAMDALRFADSEYAKGIRTFDDQAVTAITREAGKRGSVDPEKVVDFVIQPNSASRIERIKKLVTPENWKEVQHAHMESLLSSMQKARGDPLDVVVLGENLSDGLNRLGRPTIESVYGKDLADDLFKFSKVSQFVTNTQGKPTSGIVAASVALHPLKHLGKLGEMLAMKHIMVRPGFIKWINEGLTSTDTSKAIAAFTKASVYAESMLHQETGVAPVGLPITPPLPPAKPRSQFSNMIETARP